MAKVSQYFFNGLLCKIIWSRMDQGCMRAVVDVGSASCAFLRWHYSFLSANPPLPLGLIHFKTTLSINPSLLRSVTFFLSCTHLIRHSSPTIASVLPVVFYGEALISNLSFEKVSLWCSEQDKAQDIGLSSDPRLLFFFIDVFPNAADIS